MRRRRRSGDDVDAGNAGLDDSSLWATDIEITDAPTEFEWATGAGRTDDASPTELDVDGSTTGRRNRLVAAAAAACSIVLLAAVVLWPRSDGDGADGDAAESGVPSSLDGAPATTTEPTPPTTDDPSDEEATGDDTGEPGGSGDAEDGSTGPALLDPVGPADERPTSIDVPTPVSALVSPTEVVIATTDGIATLSLPSGNVRWSTTELEAVGGSIVVAPDAAAFVSTRPSGRSSIVIVPRTGQPFEVGETEGAFVRGWTTTDDGLTAFQVQRFGPDGEMTELVDTSGAVTAVDSANSSAGFSTFDYARTSALNIINDAGGVYLLGPGDSSRRVATGRAFAANGDFLLVRDCDEAYACRLAVQNYVSGEVVEVDAAVEVDNLFSLDLAPDGSAITATTTRNGSHERIALIDLAADTTLDAGRPGPNFYGPGSQWLADSSGIVQTSSDGTGLEVVARATGERVGLGEELGRIYAIGLRYPDDELPPAPGSLSPATLDLSDELTGETGIDVAVVGSLGTMARLDLDERTAVAWPVPVLPNDDGIELHHVRDTVTALGSDAGFVTTVGIASEIDSTVFEIPESPRLPGPGQGLVWERQRDDRNVDHRLRTVTPTLPATEGAEIVVPSGSLLGADGRGGLAVEAPGGVYSVTASSTEQLTTGALLALGANHTLTRECDAALECRTLLLDRATGERSSAAAPRRVGEAVRPDTEVVVPGSDLPVGGTVSPDGTLALTRFGTEPATGWVLNDLSNGSWNEIPEPAPLQPLIWSDDSRVLVYLSEAGLVVFERGTGLVRVEGLGDVIGLVRVTDEFVADGG